MAQQKDCEHCGKPFIRQEGRSNKQWKMAKFCSRRCAAHKAVNASELERLFSFVKIDPITRCWLWEGATDEAGYGFFNRDRAHRFVFNAAVGPIPDGSHVLHRCDTPPCCNPFHLFLGNKQDNWDDMRLKGRENHARGEAVGNARLTEAEVLAIRLDPRFQHEIASDYQIAQTTVSAIKRGKNWRHL